MSPTQGQSISDYFKIIVFNILDYLNLKISVNSYSDILEQENLSNSTLFKLYKEQSPENINHYNQGALIQGSKLLEDDHLPYTFISRSDGSKNYFTSKQLKQINRQSFLLAPKVLLINEFHGLILPKSAKLSKTILAREKVQVDLQLTTRHSYPDFSWTECFFNKNLLLNLTTTESIFWNKMEKLTWGNILDLASQEKPKNISDFDIFAYHFRKYSIKSIENYFFGWISFVLLDTK